MSVAEHSSRSYNSVTAFVVDDDDVYLESFRLAASRFNDLAVETFTLPKPLLAAIAARRGTRHNLFFVDIRLGPLKGFEVCEQLRKDAIYGLSPIIFMSSSLSQNDINRAFQVGGNSYFHKPTGTKARVEAVTDQLQYWLEDVKLPAAFLPEPTVTGNRAASAIAVKGDARARGKPLYALEKLRQDILVALIKDLYTLSGQPLSQSALDKLSKAIIRLQEVFSFLPEVYGREINESIAAFCKVVTDWAHLPFHKPPPNNLEEAQRRVLLGARSTRESFGKALHRAGLEQSQGRHLMRVDSWIWDVFSELGDSPLFPALYISLKRFQARAF